MLEIGKKAPNFNLPDENGDMHSLSEQKGKKVVLYFYPKDNTSGCTCQALEFARLNQEFADKGAVIIGISKDTPASHKKFKEKNSLPFLLLSDTELNAVNAYEVWQEKKMCGKTSMGVVRTTFIIDENGVITHIMPKVKAAQNPADALALL